ncbi:prp 4 CRoW domain-containing protein [Moelleriella libera RCEF 2490]|uniref:Prp 4 CRoW domain-containing protein n=1 Tax=Moelleriella libera RCEF 2490 TaxID=1081109 RepID=A0A168F763_9HYPO|nr:prp 4 CRoW domain-containing protein [Moelleriella libera RCEF 2490]
MLVQTIVSAAVLAAAANAASHEARHPYRLAVMALPGQSLMRRDTNGYTPDQKQCKAGNTCAEACGAGFDQCPGGKPDTAHCFNPTAGESCCTDNSGNSCEAGYYCTHDDKKQTWCCPKNMDLAACAAAFTVRGLVAATSTTAPPTTSVQSTISQASNTTTSAQITSSSAAPTSSTQKKTTSAGTISGGKSTAWSGVNSTVIGGIPTQPSERLPSVTAAPPPANSKATNVAAASGISALLLIAAGVAVLL